MKIAVFIITIFGISSTEGCGKPEIQGTRIIGGTFAKEGSWPWQVGIYYHQQFICGGSLLSNKWIITAAHCVDGFDSHLYQIVLGDHERSVLSGNEQVYLAAQALIHPDWDTNNLNNDLGLIELDKPVLFSKQIQPICLPESDAPVGSVCYITGWGQYSLGQQGPPSDVLKQAQLRIVSFEECYLKNTMNLGIPVTEKMICGQPINDPLDSGCHGDSGGPFVCRNAEGIWELQGAVSWGSGVCFAEQAYTVFARITQFLPWIRSYVS